MAELSVAETTAADPCCAPEQQATCCEASAKTDCCGHDDGCGCDAGHMAALPMAPSCALDEEGLRSQIERYRQAGQGASLIDKTRRRLVVDVDECVDNQLIDELIAIERECCPFFALVWESDRRRLTVSASRVEHEPALDAIAFALDLKAPGQQAASD
jgi:hypothetical protein